MIRATTPTHRFKLPIDAALVDKFRLTYVQNGVVQLQKEKSDMTVEGDVWHVTLTQEETKKFLACEASASSTINLGTCAMAEAQIRVRTTGGQVLTSKPMVLRVYPTADDEVL